MSKKLTLLFLFATFVVASPALLAKGPKTDKGQPGPTIVETAIAVNTDGPFAGQFDTLIAAVLAAEPAVAEALTSNGKLTVFAPTDDAFAALGLDPSNIAGAFSQDVLTDILLYHVTRGNRTAQTVLPAEKLRMLFGGFLYQDSGVLTDNLDREANIIVTDVEAGNGIIHAIDAVVLPYAP